MGSLPVRGLDYFHDELFGTNWGIGYTLALSDAAIPSILAAQEETLLVQQWRVQYLRGFTVCATCRLDVYGEELTEVDGYSGYNYQPFKLGISCLYLCVAHPNVPSAPPD